MTSIIKKTSILVLSVNILFWSFVFFYFSFVKFSGNENYLPLKLLLLLEPLFFILALIGYLKEVRNIYLLTIIFLIANSVLSITDEVGLFDMISLSLSIVALLLLASQWRIRLQKKHRLMNSQPCNDSQH